MLSTLNVETGISVVLNGNNGVYLYCNISDGACLLINPKEKYLNYLDPSSIIACAGGDAPIASIGNIITTYNKVLEDNYSTYQSLQRFFYIDYISIAYETGELKFEEIFGENKELQEKYVRSFQGALAKILEGIYNGTITIDMEEVGWTIPAFGLHLPFVSKILRLIKSVYRYNSGKFNSNFAVLLHKVLSSDKSNAEKVNELESLIDAVNGLKNEHSSLDHALNGIFPIHPTNMKNIS